MPNGSHDTSVAIFQNDISGANKFAVVSCWWWLQWTYGVPKIRGRMSIRVTGYDFFSKSCYICEVHYSA
jgi:hypothetical protein